MTWTRSHDALIARVAEGLEVMTCQQVCDFLRIESSYARKFYLDNGGDSWYVRPDGENMPVPAYLTDLVAVVRAAEAWQSRGRDHRAVNIRICREVTVEIVQRGFILATTHGSTTAEALARALYAACVAQDGAA